MACCRLEAPVGIIVQSYLAEINSSGRKGLSSRNGIQFQKTKSLPKSPSDPNSCLLHIFDAKLPGFPKHIITKVINGEGRRSSSTQLQQSENRSQFIFGWRGR